MAEPIACPCGSDRAYADCCQPYLTGTALPPTAEALMRWPSGPVFDHRATPPTTKARPTT